MDTSGARSRRARWAGAAYLGYIAVTIAATAVLGAVVVDDDGATVGAFHDRPGLVGLAVVLDAGAAVLFLVTAWTLYRLLRDVRSGVALLFVLLNAAGVAIQGAAAGALAAARAVGGEEGADPATVLLLVDLHAEGFVVAQFFYAAWLLPLGYLVLTSGFLPRWLGYLLIVESGAWMLYPLQHLLAPGADWLVYASSAVGFAGEFGLALWLLVRGTRETARVART
ncbi:DUF4386 domain-containing protein [Demequina pelophila]|uniref:DUF4386 domain-containing protein n=1 Tax=Demequina pelophila TaxID=1638984 RepID=UPI00078606D3|nr:DUF4386 domain-containing protein [Demequina pelophila]